MNKRKWKLRLPHKLLLLLLFPLPMLATMHKSCNQIANYFNQQEKKATFEELVKKIGIELVTQTAWAALARLSQKAAQSELAYQLYLPLANSKKQAIYKMKNLEKEIINLDHELVLFKQDKLFSALLKKKKIDRFAHLGELKVRLQHVPDNDSTLENVYHFVKNHVSIEVDCTKKELPISFQFTYES